MLSYFWYRNCPESEYVLVDIADDMLDVARKRFAGLENVDYCVYDYLNGLPEGDFDVIISALSIHHLEDEDKVKLFSQIYDKLPDSGLFVNYDQFCADQPEINDWINSYWENQLYKSGLTDNDIALWKERRKLDRECSVDEEVRMLERCSFKSVKCVYSCQKFSVIVAIK